MVILFSQLLLRGLYPKHPWIEFHFFEKGAKKLVAYYRTYVEALQQEDLIIANRKVNVIK